QDLGTGTYTVMTQIAADALGVPPARVNFRLGDTADAEAPIAAGSQTAASVGSAVKAAAGALRAKLAQLAGVQAENAAIEGDQLVIRGSAPRSVPLRELVALNHGAPLAVEIDSKPGTEQQQYSMYVFGAQFAEVRVDADLGQIRCSRMVGAFG